MLCSFTFTRVCVSLPRQLLRWSFKLLRGANHGERLERIQSRKGLENALTQCRVVTEKYEGSEETLRLILRVEESLRKLLISLD